MHRRTCLQGGKLQGYAELEGTYKFRSTLFPQLTSSHHHSLNKSNTYYTMSSPEATGIPPPFKPVDAIQLNAVEDSRIIGLSVYTGRAEITRLFKLKVQTGYNQLHINGLPNVLDNDSLRFVFDVSEPPKHSQLTSLALFFFSRVEGRGAATIHDVTISDIPSAPVPTMSLALEALLHKKDRIVKALERCKTSLLSLESYLKTLSVQHVTMSELGSVVNDYDKTAETLDSRLLGLERELKDAEKEIKKERAKLADSTVNEKLNRRVAVGLFAASEDEVTIALIYGAFEDSDSCGLSKVDSKLSGVHLGTLDTMYALICRPRRNK